MKKLFIIVAMTLIVAGSASAQKKEILALQQEVAALKGTIEVLQSNANNDRATIQQLTSINNATVGKVEAMAAKLDAATKLNSESAAEIANLKAQVATLTKALDERLAEMEGKLATAATKPAEPETPKYEVVGKMSSGMALVKEGLLYGYVNSNNEYVVPAKYEEAKDFKDGYAVVKKNDKWGIINTSGKETVACSYDDIRFLVGNIWRVKKGNLFGLVSAVNGSIIQPIKYTLIGHTDWHGNFNDQCNRYLMCINGKYGFFNEKGQVVIPAKFDSEARFYENGKANVDLNGKQYTINTSGTIIKNGYTF